MVEDEVLPCERIHGQHATSRYSPGNVLPNSAQWPTQEDLHKQYEADAGQTCEKLNLVIEAVAAAEGSSTLQKKKSKKKLTILQLMLVMEVSQVLHFFHLKCA